VKFRIGTKTDVCQWEADYDGVHNTSCNNAHAFICDGVKENKYKFCPYCGRKIKEVKT